MMKLLLTAAFAAAAATPALAQDAHAGHGAHAGHAGHDTAAAATARFTLDTPIETLVAEPAAKAALDARLGMDVTKHAHYQAFKGMSLAQVAPMSNGAITADMLAKLAADLSAIK